MIRRCVVCVVGGKLVVSKTHNTSVVLDGRGASICGTLPWRLSVEGGRGSRQTTCVFNVRRCDVFLVAFSLYPFLFRRLFFCGPKRQGMYLLSIPDVWLRRGHEGSWTLFMAYVLLYSAPGHVSVKGLPHSLVANVRFQWPIGHGAVKRGGVRATGGMHLK